MPSDTTATPSNPIVPGVRYNADESAVLCTHCDVEIPRGTDFAVQLFFEEDTNNENPIGPYCKECISKLKVCSKCNKAFFEGEYKYYGNGEFYCHECADEMDICSVCGGMHDSVEVIGDKKYCTKCKDDTFYVCQVCGEMHKKEGRTNYSELNKKRYYNLYRKWGTELCDTCFEKKVPLHKMRTVYQCGCCGNIHTGTPNPGGYCDSCYVDMLKCDHCGKKHHTLNYISGNADHYYCPTCIGLLGVCEGCGEVHLKTEIKPKRTWVGTTKLCPTCRSIDTQCKECLSYGPVNSDGLCKACSKSHIIHVCDACGAYTSKHHPCTCYSCDKGRCEPDSYNYKPDPIFHYDTKDQANFDNIFMGFENEVQVNSSDEQEAIHHIFSAGKTPFDSSDLYIKNDGSISGSGFEIVSHPYTLSTFLKTDWSSLFKYSNVHESCGMHVHFSRKCLRSDVHLFKIVQFVHENEGFCDEVAGRKYTEYQKKLQKKVSSIIKNKEEGERYQRVNLQNEETIEIRMFASAATVYQLKFRVEFVHALVSFTSECSLLNVKSGKGGPSLIQYVKDNKNVYPNLTKFVGSAERCWNQG